MLEHVEHQDRCYGPTRHQLDDLRRKGLVLAEIEPAGIDAPLGHQNDCFLVDLEAEVVVAALGQLLGQRRGSTADVQHQAGAEGQLLDEADDVPVRRPPGEVEGFHVRPSEPMEGVLAVDELGDAFGTR